MERIAIRPLTTLAESKQAQQIQRVTWDLDETETIPALTMHALQHNGALLLGAFDDDQLVGYILGVLGTVKTPNRIDQVAAARLKLFSVILGVLPAYQNQGIGFRLKQAQREFALRLGIRLITWTTDPLESRNARLNIGKLGAVCNRYHRHFHGEMVGRNAGVPSDRFELEWWVTSNRVEGRMAQQRRPLTLDALIGGGAQLVNEANFNAAGFPVPPLNYVSQPSSLQLVEIPADFQALKQHDIELAREWRSHTRAIFEALFDSGFVVTDFVSQPGPTGRQRSFYLLTYKDA